MTDLGSYIALASHVEAAHPETDTPAFEQFKGFSLSRQDQLSLGFIDKAKRSIKRFEPSIDIENLREKVGSIAASASASNVFQSESLQKNVEAVPQIRSKYVYQSNAYFYSSVLDLVSGKRNH